MELALLVYLISLLDPFAILLQWVFGLSLLALIVTCAIYCESHSPSSLFEFWNGEPAKETDYAISHGYPGYKRVFYWIFPIIAISICMRLMMPSEKTAYVMVGAYAAQKIATHPNTQEIGGKVLTIINQKLDYYSEEGRNELEELMKKK